MSYEKGACWRTVTVRAAPALGAILLITYLHPTLVRVTEACPDPCEDNPAAAGCGWDWSAYSTQNGCFEGYATRATGENKFSFATGKEFLEGLVDACENGTSIGKLYVFSHGWVYQSTSGAAHGGGFYGGGPDDSGFYGTEQATDDGDARYICEGWPSLQSLINDGVAVFAEDCKIFMEGCHVGEIGDFASWLGSTTGCTIAAAYGISFEHAIGSDFVEFESGPGNLAEKNDPDYDKWKDDGSECGKYYKVPACTCSD